MPSGYSATLPDDVLLDVAVLSRKVATVDTPFGVSRGGMSFKPTKQYRNVEFDGKRSPIAGLDRVIAHGGTISGTFIQFGAAQIADLEPASSAVTATTVTTVTPVDASTLIATSDLLEDLTMTYQRLGGGTVKIVFPLAICTEYELSGQDNSEAEIRATFEARLGVSGSDTDAAPYEIIVTDPA
jgi:hypothetical protein